MWLEAYLKMGFNQATIKVFIQKPDKLNLSGFCILVIFKFLQSKLKDLFHH